MERSADSKSASGLSEKMEADLKLGTKQPIILRFIVSLVVPFIMIYGMYIIVNGHLSPGGGFSGGAILGAGLSLTAASLGIERVRGFFSFRTYSVLSCFALLFYALVKGFSFSSGASEVYSGTGGSVLGFSGEPGTIFSAGLILPLNICIGIVVGCTIYGLFAIFLEGEV